MTLRADGQFNTRLYNHDDRFRGVKRSRMVLLMNRDDRGARSIEPGDLLTLRCRRRGGTRSHRFGSAALRRAARPCRRLLPGVQSPSAALALCEGEQGVSREVDPGACGGDRTGEGQSTPTCGASGVIGA